MKLEVNIDGETVATVKVDMVGTVYHDAIRHYDRMIVWVDQQDPEYKVSPNAMRSNLGEAWYTKDCSYCKYYICRDCPLQVEGIGCCNGRWGVMNRSSTWGDWACCARAVRRYIIDNG